MKVRDAMAKSLSTATPQESILEVAKKMKQEDAGFIPVTQGEKLLGVVTDRDIVVRCVAEGHDASGETVEHVMSKGVTTVTPEEDLTKAGEIMDKEEIRRLPVVENGKLVGVLSHGNLVQATAGSGAAQKATVGVTKGA
jgi:CBS domain-containing protein